MSEADWLSSTDPQAMLRAVGPRLTCRKLRLFACAVCRADPSLMGHDRLRQSVEVCERYADGDCTEEERDALYEVAWAELDEANEDGDRWRPYHELAYHLLHPDTEFNWHDPSCWETETVDPWFQAAVVRDLFGSLHQQVPIDSGWMSWNSGRVPVLARTIYAGRQFYRLPLLADALEEAGCCEASILGHCRTPGIHVRGCWVLDLMLNRQ